MDDSDDLYKVGRFDARCLAFLETISTLRPSLHRYCARMTGSISEGEDVVQEALFQAYRRLDTFDETRPMKAWLFASRTIDASTFCGGEASARRLRRRSRPTRQSTRSTPWGPGSTAPSSTSL